MKAKLFAMRPSLARALLPLQFEAFTADLVPQVEKWHRKQTSDGGDGSRDADLATAVSASAPSKGAPLAPSGASAAGAKAEEENLYDF